MVDMMTFPETWEEFEQFYGITDTEEIYTNGERLIPSFRVEQWLKAKENSMRKEEFSAEQITNLVMKLNGAVEPIGETNTDNVRFENLVRLQDVIDNLLKEVYCVCCYADNFEFSMHRSGDRAIDWLEQTNEWLNSIFIAKEEESYDGN